MAQVKPAKSSREKEEQKKFALLKKRIADKSIANQKIWQYVEERNSARKEDLEAIAIIDCTREYTYKEVFKERDRYARAFSGLGIGQKNKSRVAVAGAITAEPVFAFLGLNMVGAEVSMFSYPDFLPGGYWKNMIENEKITDLIIQDIFVTPSLLKEIRKGKEEFGLKHVLLIHSKMGGPCTGPAELLYNEFNYHSLKRNRDIYFIDDMIEKYASCEIEHGKLTKDGIALICHTSGTTHGSKKPIVYNEKELLEMDTEVTGYYDSRLGEKGFYGERTRQAVIFDYSAFHSLWSWVMGPMISGNIVILTFFGFLHPKFIKAIGYYGINDLQTSGFMLDQWLKRDDIDDEDFSSVKYASVVGSFISDDNKKRYMKFFKDHKVEGEIDQVYGMSEISDNFFFGPLENEDMGIASYPEYIRIWDEKKKKFFKLDDGPRTGILYMSGEASCQNGLNGEKLFNYTRIDGKDYICTNDLIRVEKDKKVMYVGRADKYFVNNDGKRFDSGIVENQLTRHSKIDKCAVAPVLEKRIHDTVPILYAVPAKPGENAAEDIRQAFVDIYVKDKKIDADNIPVQLMVVDTLPVNQNGKIDIFKITRERLLGDAYNIIPVRKNGQLTDIKFEHVDKLNSIVAATPEGMGSGSAFNIFEIFN